jgi:hypothetical protein
VSQAAGGGAEGRRGGREPGGRVHRQVSSGSSGQTMQSVMPSEKSCCPGCGQALTRIVDHGVHCRCAGCGGQLLGLRPFEKLLAEGEGARIWVASEDGQAAGNCPFCEQSMRALPASAGPEGLAVCRICEQVWIPASAEPWIREHAAGGAAAGPTPAPELPSQCGECGAPWQPDDMGRCPYCRAQLTESAVAVVIPGVAGPWSR